mmetsp:Transcript_28520/g.59964  ORF Transcript_28520/g.59964 Transcript_28520/m.59964 type:complete len:267 (-) Transcript_28520:448-1248(-)
MEYPSEGKMASKAASVQGRFLVSISLSIDNAFVSVPARGVWAPSGITAPDVKGVARGCCIIEGAGVASHLDRFLPPSAEAPAPIMGVADGMIPDASMGVSSHCFPVMRGVASGAVPLPTMGVAATPPDATTGVSSQRLRRLVPAEAPVETSSSQRDAAVVAVVVLFATEFSPSVTIPILSSSGCVFTKSLEVSSQRLLLLLFCPSFPSGPPISSLSFPVFSSNLALNSPVSSSNNSFLALSNNSFLSLSKLEFTMASLKDMPSSRI